MSAPSAPIDSTAPRHWFPSCVRGPAATGRRAGLVLAAVLICAGAGCSSEARIWVDNGGGEPMVLTVDGQKSLTIAPGTYETFTCEPGQHRFHVQMGDEVLLDEVKTIDEPKVVGMGRRYLLNPDNRNRYRTYTVKYGESLFDGLFETSAEEPEPENEAEAIRQAYREASEAPELLPPEPWLEIVGIQHVLTDEPEFVVTRTGSEKRRVLTRVAPEDYEFIAASRKNRNPTEQDLIALFEVVMRVLHTGNE